MKTKKILTLVCAAVICVTQFSCKKDKVDTPVPAAKKYLPSTILKQNTSTAATIYDIAIAYNSNESVSSISQVSASRTITWTFNYNQNGTLNTASMNNSTSGTAIYTAAYDANNKLSRIISSGSFVDTLNMNYIAASNTYVGNSGAHNGIRLVFNSLGQFDNMQNWAGALNLNSIYQTSEKGIFVDANIDQSFVILMTVFEGFFTDYSFFHKQQISSCTFGTTTYNYQNYVRNANGYISTFQINSSSSSVVPSSYTLTYLEQ